jgi:ABC-2 type transport system permease protein
VKRVLLIAGHESRLLRISPWVVTLLIVMPVVLSAFFTNGAVGGPAQAITGMAALFGFFGISSIGVAFYRDHGWMTWDRIRVSGARPFEVAVGKLVPLAVVFIAQYAVLFTLGRTVFQMPWRGSVAGGVLVVLALVAVELAFGLLLAVVCTSINQLNAVSSLLALLLAGVGGALAPVGTLPAWAQHLSPVSPVYWALDGFRTVIVGGGSLGDVLRPSAVLCAMALGMTVLSVLLYDHEKRKLFYA